MEIRHSEIPKLNEEIIKIKNQMYRICIRVKPIYQQLLDQAHAFTEATHENDWVDFTFFLTNFAFLEGKREQLITKLQSTIHSIKDVLRYTKTKRKSATILPFSVQRLLITPLWNGLYDNSGTC